MPADSRTGAGLSKAIREADDAERWEWLRSLTVQNRAIIVLDAAGRDKEWTDVVFQLNTALLSFGSRVVLDVLPTNANLLRWGKSNDGTCKHCGWKENAMHVLSVCRMQLAKFKWRHDSALNKLADLFVESLARGVRLYVDLAQHACSFPGQQFPPSIGQTRLRHDLVFVSEAQSTVWLLELTAGAEENVAAAFARKTAKYVELASDLRQRWSKVHCRTIELGCRGLMGTAISSCVRWLSETGALGSASRRSAQALSLDVSKLLLAASFWIWNTRGTAEIPDNMLLLS